MSQMKNLKITGKKTKQSSTMTRFDNIVVVNVGVEPKEHFLSSRTQMVAT